MKSNKITKDLLERYFEISPHYSKYKLKYGNGRNNIFIKIPFQLDEDCARFAGMMPDGSLIKDLMRIYFHQKKDLNKIKLFRDLITKIFSPKNKIFTKIDKKGCTDIYTNSKTLARFCYHIIGIPKSNEQMRIPSWIFGSSKSVRIAYLQQAYDMEGTILKSLSEIRFITKDEEFAFDIKKILASLDIESYIKPRIGGINRTRQYRISIYKKENFAKFKEIGFRIPFNKKRFVQLVKKYNL
ncbi:hypothetical protein GOV06_01210 [Candidatus Woesearchaeota archaeon]|nr:hypothetical protein [Candidatus Woesearchaeota archaeon]